MAKTLTNPQISLDTLYGVGRLADTSNDTPPLNIASGHSGRCIGSIPLPWPVLQADTPSAKLAYYQQLVNLAKYYKLLSERLSIDYRVSKDPEIAQMWSLACDQYCRINEQIARLAPPHPFL